jgi:hypothetical protein
MRKILGTLRFLFIVGSLGGMWIGLKGLWIIHQTHGITTAMSINDIVGHPTGNLPKLLEVSGADYSAAVCVYNKLTNDEKSENKTCDNVLIPLLTAQQAEDASAGKDVTAAVVVKGDDVLVRKYSQDKNYLNGVTSLKGVVGSDVFDDDTGKAETFLRQYHVLTDGNTVLLDMTNVPESSGESIFEFFFALIVGALAAFLPWGKKQVVEEI